MYTDRLTAGRRLVEDVRGMNIEPDRVLGIPRGALPVASAVADGIDCPLDVIVSRKIEAPNREDVSVGSVTPGGDVWLNQTYIEELDVSQEYLDQAVQAERERATNKLEKYRDGSQPDVSEENVLIVDDGTATGATARLCIQRAYECGAETVGVAVPVSSPLGLEVLEGEADEVVCPKCPSGFRAVYDYYENFDQIPDEEAMEYL